MIPREADYATPTVSLRRPFAPLVRRLRAAGRTTARLLSMHQPVTGWRHDWAVTSDTHDCLAYIPGAESLLIYDPASTSGEAWLHSDVPCDLRSWA